MLRGKRFLTIAVAAALAGAMVPSYTYAGNTDSTVSADAQNGENRARTDGAVKKISAQETDEINAKAVKAQEMANEAQAVAAPATSDMLQTAEPSYMSDTRAMYRLYNKSSGEHFYTASKTEERGLVKKGWRYEGIAWRAPKKSSTPVYRVYNPNSGDHHYTTSKGECNHLVDAGWKYEGIGWYSDDEHGVPLYREYNKNAKTGSHNYTASRGEHNSLVEEGWRDEGIGWYGADVTKAEKLTFEDDPAYASITADVVLKGTGSGYHAKIDMSSALPLKSGDIPVVSWGFHYEKDVHGLGEGFENNTCFLLENMYSHVAESGGVGKQYLRYAGAERDRKINLRLSYYEDGTIAYYVNDYLFGRQKTALKAPFIFTIEGSAARNGDTIDATYTNVRIKAGNATEAEAGNEGVQGTWNASNNYFGLQGEVTDNGTVRDDGQYSTNGEASYDASMHITGTADVPGEDPNGYPYDWDSTLQYLGHPLSAQIVIGQKY